MDTSGVGGCLVCQLCQECVVYCWELVSFLANGMLISAVPDSWLLRSAQWVLPAMSWRGLSDGQISSVESQKGTRSIFQDVLLRIRRALSIFKDVTLRIRRALSLYNVYGNSALLVLSRTSFYNDSVLLALNWRYVVILFVKCLWQSCLELQTFQMVKMKGLCADHTCFSEQLLEALRPVSQTQRVAHAGTKRMVYPWKWIQSHAKLFLLTVFERWSWGQQAPTQNWAKLLENTRS